MINPLKGDLQAQLIWCKRAQWALVAAMFSVAALFYLAWIHPSLREMGDLKLRFTTARAELERDQAQARDLPRVEAEIDRLRQRVERFDKKLPHQHECAQFISDVAKFSQHASLTKLTWHPDTQPRRTDQFAELPIQFSCSGDFTSVCDFLRQTEDMQRLTRVRKLDITSHDKRDGKVDVQLTLNIYFAEE